MLKKNQVAPSFKLPNQDNEIIDLSAYKGKKNVVLYFYPKDDTSGCTLEAQQFTNLIDEFAKLDTIIIGVSKDDCDSHRRFIDKYELKVELISDTTGELCQQYGVWQEKEKAGVKKMGIVRSTFIINKDGMVQQALYGVSADGHAKDILARLQ